MIATSKYFLLLFDINILDHISLPKYKNTYFHIYMQSNLENYVISYACNHYEKNPYSSKNRYCDADQFYDPLN